MVHRMTRDRYLSDAELARFMGAVGSRRHKNQPRDHAFFALLSNTGIRPSEAQGLSVRDVRKVQGKTCIMVDRARRPYSGHPVTEIVLNAQVVTVLRRFMTQMPKGDCNRKLFPFTRRQSRRLFHYYRKLAGIAHPYRIYSLRHTVGMRLWRFTRDIRLIQALLGHQRMKATAAYVHVAPERLQAAIEQSAEILGGANA